MSNHKGITWSQFEKLVAKNAIDEVVFESLVSIREAVKANQKEWDKFSNDTTSDIPDQLKFTLQCLEKIAATANHHKVNLDEDFFNDDPLKSRRMVYSIMEGYSFTDLITDKGKELSPMMYRLWTARYLQDEREQLLRMYYAVTEGLPVNELLAQYYLMLRIN